MKLYTTWQTPIHHDPTGLSKHRDLPLNTVVEAAAEAVNGRTLVTDGKVAGWVDNARLAPYMEQLPKDCVDLKGIQTITPNDAEQYIVWGGEKIVNACGMISVAYILGKPLTEILTRWAEEEPKHYRYVDGQNWLTSEIDLMRIFSVFGVESSTYRQPRLTPYALEQEMDKHHLIMGVWINRYTGRLDRSGIRHWVVPTGQFIERTGYGTIDLFNPFPNRVERYSWAEFSAAVGNVGGVKV